MPLEVLIDGPGRAAWNMALDEALLDAGGTWLRIYQWDRPTLSLGYFQRIADFTGVDAAIPRVRRPTGGGAILHARELTITLAGPDGLLPAVARESYRLLNDAVAAAAGGRLRPPAEPSTERSPWCFAHAVGLDLVQPDGRKVFGSAQRRRRRRFLQHGSLILERHPLTPFTGALGGERASELTARLVGEVAARTGLAPVHHAGPPGATLRAAAALETRYASSRWTGRR